MKKERFSLILNNASLNNELKENDVPFKTIRGMSVSIRHIINETDTEIVWEYVSNKKLEEMNSTFDTMYEVAFESDEIHGYEIIDIMQAIGTNPMLSKAKANKYKTANNKQRLFIISNKEKVNGSTAILHDDFMEKVFDIIDGDVFLIPINTHQMYCVSTDISANTLAKYKAMLNNPLKQEKELKNDLIRIERRKV